MASPGSDGLAPPSSLLRRKDDPHGKSPWNTRGTNSKLEHTNPLDVSVQALRMRELQKYNADIACLPEVRIPDIGHFVIKVPGEESYFRLYHIEVVNNWGRYDAVIALTEAAQAQLLAWVSISPRTVLF